MEDFEEKCARLKYMIDEYAKEDVIIAFSGGVDSSLLLKMTCMAAAKTKKQVYAVTIETKLHPSEDKDIARKVAKEAGAIHRIVYVDELKEAGIEDNPKNRCYLCKKCLFSKIYDMAASLKIKTMLEGTNEDDLHVYRPGIQAVRELGVNSPLADAGMTKVDIRKLAEEYDISVAKRPASPCLATRFPYGTTLSFKLMKKIEQGESFLRQLGLYNVRIRVHHEIARIEVDEEDITLLVSQRCDILQHLKELGFNYITVDLEGFRSGSMDEKKMEDE